MRSIPDLHKYTNLRFVHLKHNNFTKLGGADHCLKIEELNMANNLLVKVTFLCSLKMLQRLDLSYNRIRSLEGIHGAVQLRELNISGNFLSTLDHLSGLAHLEQIYAMDNFVESKSEALKLKVRIS